jgi:thiol-disulfide isomerase/thioredoxin
MMKITLNLKILITVVALLALVAVGYWGMTGWFVGPQTNKDDFAKCLAQKGTAMYGAEWCGHCKRQKDMFGSSFQYINYVECPRNQQLCSEKGITGYPTWIIDGKLYPGEQSLERLSELSGCPLS